MEVVFVLSVQLFYGICLRNNLSFDVVKNLLSLFDMNSHVIINVVTIFITFIFASSKIIYACGLFTNEVFTNLGHCLCMGLFDQSCSHFVDFWF